MNKVCSKCKIEKSVECFSKNKTRVDRLQHLCKECCNIYRKKYCQDHKEEAKQYCASGRLRELHRKDPRKHMIINARHRSKKKGWDFDLTIDDIIIPEYCPILRIPLDVSQGRPCAGSPSLDRIDNNKPYLKENIRVISHLANTIKGTATREDIKLVYENWYNK